MFLSRISAFLYFLNILGKALLHDLSDLSKPFYKLWRIIREHSKHILIYQDLSIAAHTGTDTDRRNFQLVCDDLCQLRRNTFQNNRKGSCFLYGKCSINNTLGSL